jgi:signal transduction histidine kinase
VDLAALIDAIAPAIPALAIANRLPPATSVRTDQTQLLRVLANLLRNAAEAGAPSATIALDPAPPETTTPSLAILIADTGPGLPEAISAHLFQPFVAGGRPGGTGLGLAIAADLMRVLGGELTLAETGPAGTVFRLVLPTAAALAPPRLEQPIQRAV